MREQLVRDLHWHVERLRMVSGLDGVPSSRLRGLGASARAFWEKRALILERLGQVYDVDVDHDLLDLAVIWTDLDVRLAAANEVSAARRRALEVLAEVTELFGPWTILEEAQQGHQRALGLPLTEAPRRAGLVPPTVWERNALGRSLLLAGDLERAAAELKEGRRLEPHNPWANYYYGLCAYRLKRYGEAAQAFSVCVGAAPGLAGCYYSRALALTALGQTDDAVDDYDQALQLDSTMAGALLNRGMLRYQKGRHEQALEDLRQALAQGAEPALVYYDLALVHLARRERDAALDCVEQALRSDPHHQEAARLRRTLGERGR